MKIYLAVLLLVLAGWAGAAPAPTPMLAAIRAQDWATAGRLAAQEGDSQLAGELVRFIRLLRPGQAAPEEILGFLKTHPDWPDRAVLIKRLGEAVVTEPDDQAVLPICQAQHFAAAPLARCAAALAATGHAAQAAAAARTAWTAGLTDSGEEADFLARWNAVLTPEDQWRRFETLVDADPAAATRQLARLDPDHRQAALARLAWKHDDPDAAARLDAVPEALRTDPPLVLEQARSLRRSGALDAAVALWRGAGIAAETAATAAARAPFWTERDVLARKLLAAGSDTDAAFLAEDHLVQGDPSLDTLFLSGWIALRRQHDPALAVARFGALAKLSHSAISQGRAHYWLARALADANKTAQAHVEYAAAAAWPTTYYGQLAGLELGDEAGRQRGLRDPAWAPAQALGFAAQPLARAAELLVEWGDPLRARDFLLRLAETAPDDTARAWDAQLALRLHMPEVAVQVARLAGRAGGMLPGAGWPLPPLVRLPRDNAALVLAIMRQESNFDAAVVSPAGARGLMQVMPATARMVAAKGADLFDPAANTRIGSAYLQQLLEQFSAEPALAAAAYNAGPGRVRAWIAMADPGAGDAARLIDWIELIPFAETRNYVQRVLEGQTIYAAKLAASR